MKYHEGDRVRITHEYYGHGYDIGKIVILKDFDKYENMWDSYNPDRKWEEWFIKDNEFIPIIRELHNDLFGKVIVL
jgi:hypothetical protein